MSAATIHHSPYSGSWYPGRPSELEHLLDDLWRRSERRTGPWLHPRARAFVVPHAGLMYSGVVAASVYRHLEKQKPARVVLLGFAHRGCSPGVWTPDIERFETPLGTMDVDRGAADELVALGVCRRVPEADLCDHSVEIQLPLLQRGVPAARLVPLYVGHLDSGLRTEIGASLARWLPADAVLVASSDLTHYGSAFGYQPFPVNSSTPERLRELDLECIDAAGSLNDTLFLRTLRERSATVCGYEPVSLLLATLRALDPQEEIFQETLDYQTSGEITGDYHHSVSYGALGYFPHTSFELDVASQEGLLQIARETLRRYQKTGSTHVPPPREQDLPALERRSAVFVTLHKNGQLRGCLGRSRADTPLREAVAELTLSTALEDTRFEPVSPSETGLEIEISVLTPMKRILDLAQFQVNIHGAVLHSGRRQGLLLPQVASERAWSAEQFFAALARKAGAEQGVYSDPATQIRIFRAQVIH